MPKRPIYDLMVAGRLAPRMNSNQDNEPLGEIAYDEQPSVLNPSGFRWHT